MSDLLVSAMSDDIGLRRESRLDAVELPLWLARLQQAIPVGASIRLSIEGDLPVPAELLTEGAGFRGRLPELVRERTLPDYVEAGLHYLVCGLNPSLAAADAGVGFVTATNRFWPAARQAGIVSSDRRPIDAVKEDRVGFTDLVKRATTSATELARAEYRSGWRRLERLCCWLAPTTVVVVGLTGWRQAIGADARPGWQDQLLGPAAVYLMPNPSGLNTHETTASLVEHFERAATPPPG